MYINFFFLKFQSKLSLFLSFQSKSEHLDVKSEVRLHNTMCHQTQSVLIPERFIKPCDTFS